MYHEVIIVGNLGKDPEMKYLPSGTAVTTISVATSRGYTNSNGEQIEETCWFRVSVFGKRGEAVNRYLHKGSRVFIRGVLRPDHQTGGPRLWEHEGKWYSAYELIADELKFVDKKGDNGGTTEPAKAEKSSPSEPQYVDEDGIPF